MNEYAIQPRCPACRLHLALCVCHLAPKLDLGTRVEMIIHHADAGKTTNSGRLVALCLTNSALFPGRDSQELTLAYVATLTPPLTLLIPGTYLLSHLTENL